MNQEVFTNLVRKKGTMLYRDMPWRRDTSPFSVLVSELMLQQTQVARVVPKFEAFMEQFPSVQALAQASLSGVLRAWSGLGYNRRAKYLHDAAKIIVSEHKGALPSDYEQLKRLPGIGSATAGAIMVYAFNRPMVFIETNVRTVYFYHFFDNDGRISDAQLAPLIESTLDNHNPRGFYWALMDYGTELKQSLGKNLNEQSLHYKKQSPFTGSTRQMRGQIVRLLGENDKTLAALQANFIADERFPAVLKSLCKDGLVIETEGVFYLTK